MHSCRRKVHWVGTRLWGDWIECFHHKPSIPNPSTEIYSNGKTRVILLHPNLPQCLQGGKGAEIRRALGGPYLVQELIAIGADLAGEGFALAGVLRQARLVRPEAVARIPVQRHVLLPPGGVGGAELVERRMHGFQDTFYTV